MNANLNFTAQFFKPSFDFKKGISVEIDDDGEFLRYQGTNEKVSRPCKIYFNKSGEPFFNMLGRRQYLRDFYRVLS